MNVDQIHNLEILMGLLQQTDESLYEVSMALGIPEEKQPSIEIVELENVQNEETASEEQVVDALEAETTDDGDAGSQALVLEEYVDAVLTELSSGRFNTSPAHLEILNLNVGNAFDDLASENQTVSSYNIRFNSSALLSVLLHEQNHHTGQSSGNGNFGSTSPQELPNLGNGGPPKSGNVVVASVLELGPPDDQLSNSQSPDNWIDSDDVLDDENNGQDLLLPLNNNNIGNAGGQSNNIGNSVNVFDHNANSNNLISMSGDDFSIM